MPETKKTLFLLDAYALIYRAYYAFIRAPRVNSKGLNTSAIYGFTNTLLDIVNNHNPTHLAVVIDYPGPTFRDDLYKDYKANRESTPEDIKKAVPYIKRILEAMNIPLLEAEGFEADDVIGTLAKMASGNDYMTYPPTIPRGTLQLYLEGYSMFSHFPTEVFLLFFVLVGWGCSSAASLRVSLAGSCSCSIGSSSAMTS